MLIRRGQGDFPRVYRPYSPYELCGQEEIKRIIANSFENRTVSHSYLFHGPSGTGKTTCARIIGLGLMCEKGKPGRPCGKCQSCQSIMGGGYIDYVELNNADLTQVDKMRELKDSFHAYPIFSDRKVFVFDECHKMSDASQNLLLKEVEDAKDFIHFIFCSTDPEKIIEPLRNRCMPLEFELVADAQIRRMVMDACDWERIACTDSELDAIVKVAAGRPRNALFELQKAVEAGRVQKAGSSRIYTIRHTEDGKREIVVSLSDPFSAGAFEAGIKQDLVKESKHSCFDKAPARPMPATMILTASGESLKCISPVSPLPEDLREMLAENKTDILRILNGHDEDPEPDPDPSDPSPRTSKPNESKEGADKAVKKVSPVIISVSRRTDIPGYHSDWFINRLAQGYLVYKAPYGGKLVRVSFENTRMLVFWTKNPAPMMPRLCELDHYGIGYYFQFTLNDYEAEGLEANLPSLENRIEAFRNLSSRIGKERVVWRFDPLILTETITPEILVQRVDKIAEQLSGHTEKLVFSFFKSGIHKKADRKLDKAGIQYRDFTAEEVSFVAKELGHIGKEYNLTVAACAEDENLFLYGIKPNKCIDDKLMRRVCSHDKALMAHLNNPANLSAPGQRKSCRCIASEDIGQYGTCRHNCLYCYANNSEKAVEQNFKRIDQEAEILLPPKERKINRVQDWSGKSINCCNGCSNGCLYCYARGEAVLHYKRLTDEQWKLGAVREKDVNRNYPKYDETVMFPSTHDITWDNFEACHTVLCKLVQAGNRVLIVSKPRPELIGILCDDFEWYKDQIAFRFTIGSNRDEILSFWEPNAPKFEDRKISLVHAFMKGFRTSISMEPMLDSENLSGLVEELRPFVNWRIWIGTMNHAWFIRKYKDPAIDAAFVEIEAGQTKDRLQTIYDRYKDDPLIRFKGDLLMDLGLPPNEKSEDWPED